MVASVTNMLNNITLPRSVGPHFPSDLNTANQVTNVVISILRESITEAVPLPLNQVKKLTHRMQDFSKLARRISVHSISYNYSKYQKSSTIFSTKATRRDGGNPKL